MLLISSLLSTGYSIVNSDLVIKISGIGEQIFGGIFLFLTLFFTMIALVQGTLAYLVLRYRSTNTEGTIEKMIGTEIIQKFEWNVYRVEYSFLVYVKDKEIGDNFKIRMHKVLHRSSYLSKKAWGSLKEGQKVRVLYLPNDPTQNRLADYRPRDSTINAVFMPLLLLGTSVIVILYFWGK